MARSGKIIFVSLPLIFLSCLVLTGCGREAVVGLGLEEVLAAKGKPVSIVTAGERTIVRWADEVVQFDGRFATHVERRNLECEAAVRARCEKAAAALAARRMAEVQRAMELRRQAEAETQSYVQSLEAQRRSDEQLAMQEDEKMRQSSFGSIEPISVQCPRGVSERIGLAFSPTAYPASGVRPKHAAIRLTRN